MLSCKEFFFTLLIIELLTLIVPAQVFDPNPNSPNYNRIRDKNIENRSSPVSKRKISGSQDKLLKPNVKDFAKYRKFLLHNKGGIFRLYPDFNCQLNNVVKKGECNKLIDGSWEYSFRQKYYSYDLRFKDGKFISRNFFSQGILVNLGDVPLKDVSTATNGLRFLQDFAPAGKFNEVEKQKAQLGEGINSDGFFYANNVAAEENKSYALRVIAYRNNFSENTIKMFQETGDSNFYESAFDTPRIDLIVAFRIIRKEKNGSLTILWKQLSSQESPVLSFP